MPVGKKKSESGTAALLPPHNRGLCQPAKGQRTPALSRDAPFRILFFPRTRCLPSPLLCSEYTCSGVGGFSTSHSTRPAFSRPIPTLLPALAPSSQDLESLNSLVVSREPSKVRTLPRTVLQILGEHRYLKAGYHQQSRGSEGRVLCACTLEATQLPLIASRAQSDRESADSA